MPPSIIAVKTQFYLANSVFEACLAGTRPCRLSVVGGPIYEIFLCFWKDHRIYISFAIIQMEAEMYASSEASPMTTK